MAIDLTGVRSWLKARGAAVALEAVVNFIGPYAIYSLTRAQLGEVGALIASSAPPIAWSALEFMRRRRVDALSLLVLTGIALSLLAFLGGGGPKFLLLRERLVTAGIALLFLGSAAIGRPLIYHLARAGLQRREPSELADFEAMRDNASFRRVMMIMTLVWGFGLAAEAVVGVVLVLTLSTKAYLLASPVLGYGTMGALGLWTLWYRVRARRRGLALRAAKDVSAATPADG